jgi:hypothetical protein
MVQPEVEFLLLADAVEAVQGKLYMLGGAWDRWFATSYPTQVRMGVAIGISVPWECTNEKIPIRMRIVDADGQLIGPGEVSAAVEVGRPPGITQGTQQRAILALNTMFPLERAGRNEVRVQVGEGPERTVPFEATLGAKPPS